MREISTVGVRLERSVTTCVQPGAIYKGCKDNNYDQTFRLSEWTTKHSGRNRGTPFRHITTAVQWRRKQHESGGHGEHRSASLRGP